MSGSEPRGPYLEYLDSLVKDWPEFKPLQNRVDNMAWRFRYNAYLYGKTGHVSLCDTRENSDSCDIVHMDAATESYIPLLDHALASLSNEVKSRVIVLAFDDDSSIDQGVLHLLRLKINVDPLFFLETLTTIRQDKFKEPPRSRAILRLGCMTLTVIKSSQHGIQDTPRVPIALVAINQSKIPWFGQESERKIEPVIDQFFLYLRQCPYWKPTEGSKAFVDARRNRREEIKEVGLRRVFCSLLSRKSTGSAEDDLLHCIHMMATTHLALFWQILAHYQLAHDGKTEEDPNLTHDLGQVVEKFRCDIDHFQRFLRSNFPEFTTCIGNPWQLLREDQENLHAEGAAMKTAFRQAYNSTLSEAQREDTRLSIEEAKTVKLITYIFLVYTPLSLASAIFGMNVQQINNSGHSVSAFAVTAIVFTFFTFVAYLTAKKVRRVWKTRNSMGPYSFIGHMQLFGDALRHPKRWFAENPWESVLEIVTYRRFGYTRRRTAEVFRGKGRAR